MKEAIISPRIKKSNLDLQELSNYRPVSNLSIFSKLLERLVVKRLVVHIEANNLLLSKQSAYRKYHSTETALLRLASEVIRASESGNLSLLSLLDINAAFDMVNHSILLQKLTRTYGVNGVTLEWLKSYVRDRHQVV